MIKHSVTCPSCKFPNVAGSRRCLSCKQVLPEDAPVTPRSLDPQEKTRALLRPSDVGTRPNNPPRAAVEDVTDPHLKVPKHLRQAADEPPSARDTGKVWASYAEDEPVVAWLQCDPLPPIALGPKRYVALGRGSECDLVLPHPTVSRVHAVLRVIGRQVVLEDRSTYGTYLNGRQVSSAQVELGDKIGVGPYELHILSQETVGEEDTLAEETRPLDLSPFQGGRSGAELMGTLERVSLAEIFQGFEFNAKSGTLRIVSGPIRGELHVRSGAPLRAELGALRDQEAVMAMLRLRKGSFTFTGCEPEGERTLQVSFTGLLLEASRLLDERDA